MPLYHVQDDDAPMFILARNFYEALEKWQEIITEAVGEDVGPPMGIHYVCDDHEFALDDRWPEETDEEGPGFSMNRCSIHKIDYESAYGCPKCKAENQ